MSRISLAEALTRLPDLISRVSAGEEVIIEQVDGPDLLLQRAVERFDIPDPPPSHDGPALAAWFRAVQVADQPGSMNAAELIRKMRDEEL